MSPRPKKTEENLTDLGNARRFVALHHADLRYVHTWGWVHWDGKRWSRDVSGEAQRRAKDTARSIWQEALRAKDADKRAALGKHASTSERATAIRAALALAQTEPELVATVEQFDRDPWLLTVNNGTIDLRTGLLRDHSRADFITRLAPVDFNPNAKCPRFERFLEEIMAGDPETVAFLQRAIGYSLTGDTSEQCLFFLHGGGSNGKGALMRTLEALLGRGEHFKKARFVTFLERRLDAVRADLAELCGPRLVSAEESGNSARLDEGLVKELTGQDSITARFLYQPEFSYRPAFKLWFASNHKPRIRGTDEGIWRRIRLIPFTVHIAEPDRMLEPTIQGAELPGVLAWAVRGCLAWQRLGLGTPLRVREATRTYRTEEDTFGRFLDECCIYEECAESGTSLLHTRYKVWAETQGIDWPLSLQGFGRELNARGFTDRKDSSGRVVKLGLRLRRDNETDGPRTTEDHGGIPGRFRTSAHRAEFPDIPRFPPFLRCPPRCLMRTQRTLVELSSIWSRTRATRSRIFGRSRMNGAGCRTTDPHYRDKS